MKTLALTVGFSIMLAACAAPEGSPQENTPRSKSAQTAEDDDDAKASGAKTVVSEVVAPDVTPVTTGPACNATDPRAQAVEIFVQPEAGDKPYVDLLKSATKSIRVLGYLMGTGGVLDTLKERAQAGVDVRVLLDGQKQLDVNTKYRTQLEAAGAHVQWSDVKFSYMHAKSMVVDDARAIVSTGNYSNSYIARERNYLALDTDPQDVRDIAALFDADWQQKSPDLTCTRLLVSPVNAKDRLVELIDGAKHTLDIESMQFNESGVRDAVLARAKAGVKVRVLLADPSWIDANQAAGDGLVLANIEARHLATPGVHVKAIAVDGMHAYIGSENISYTSLTKNREIGVILDDAPVLATMKTTFESDWSNATPFTK